MKKKDVILIVCVLAVAAVFEIYQLWNRETGEMAVVYEGEHELVRFSLKENTEYLICSSGGGTNRLLIQNGQADITEASCPDKICVHQKAITETGETIVCMPNKVIITIETTTR